MIVSPTPADRQRARAIRARLRREHRRPLTLRARELLGEGMTPEEVADALAPVIDALVPLGALEGRDREIEALRLRVGWEVAERDREAGARTVATAVDLAPIEARLNAVQVETTQAQAARALRDFLNNAPTDIETLIAEVRRLTDALEESDTRGCDAAGEADAVLATLLSEREDARAEVRCLTKERDEARAALKAARLDGAREGTRAAADYIEQASIPLPIADWMGTKRDLVAAFARALAKKVRALDPATVVGSTPHESTATPWDDCKVAFGVDDDERVWAAKDTGTLALPEGWALVETDTSGARVVAVFRVEGAPSMADGRQVARSLAAVVGSGS